MLMHWTSSTFLSSIRFNDLLWAFGSEIASEIKWIYSTLRQPTCQSLHYLMRIWIACMILIVIIDTQLLMLHYFIDHISAIWLAGYHATYAGQATDRSGEPCLLLLDSTSQQECYAHLRCSARTSVWNGTQPVTLRRLVYEETNDNISASDLEMLLAVYIWDRLACLSASFVTVVNNNTS